MDEDDDIPPPPRDGILQIQDEDEWFRRNTLRNEAAPTLAQLEDVAEARRAQSYADEAMERAFAGEATAADAEKKRSRIREWRSEGRVLRIRVGGESTTATFPLAVLAAQSDVIYALASTNERYKVDGKKKEGSDDISVSLEDHDPAVVRDFLDLVTLVDERRGKDDDDASSELSEAACADLLSDHIRNRGAVGDHLVPCCRLANFWQCREIQSGCVNIFCASVDTPNCMSFYQLADELGLVRLAEVSLGHMMRTMGDVQSHDVWEDLSSELRSRILAIQELLEKEGQKSRGDPAQRQRVYFGSFFEYLSIFAEQVDYYKERLANAKQQQRLYVERIEREKQQREEFVAQEAREGRFHYYVNNETESSAVDPEMRYGKAWRYAQDKIEQQERRVRRLEACMIQQKQMFLANGLR